MKKLLLIVSLFIGLNAAVVHNATAVDCDILDDKCIFSPTNPPSVWNGSLRIFYEYVSRVAKAHVPASVAIGDTPDSDTNGPFYGTLPFGRKYIERNIPFAREVRRANKSGDHSKITPMFVEQFLKWEHYYPLCQSISYRDDTCHELFSQEVL